MRNGRYVSNISDAKSSGLQTAQSRFTTRSRSVHEDGDGANPVITGNTSTIFSGDLSGEGSALTSAPEAALASGRPGHHSARRVGDGDDGVVERALDVRVSVRNVPFIGLLFTDDFLAGLFRRRIFYFFRSFRYGLLGLSTHSILHYFETLSCLRTATVLRGPLRVRELVCVRCPRTGRPLRCRRPR